MFKQTRFTGRMNDGVCLALAVLKRLGGEMSVMKKQIQRWTKNWCQYKQINNVNPSTRFLSALPDLIKWQ